MQINKLMCLKKLYEKLEEIKRNIPNKGILLKSKINI